MYCLNRSWTDKLEQVLYWFGMILWTPPSVIYPCHCLFVCCLLPVYVLYLQWHHYGILPFPTQIINSWRSSFLRSSFLLCYCQHTIVDSKLLHKHYIIGLVTKRFIHQLPKKCTLELLTEMTEDDVSIRKHLLRTGYLILLNDYLLSAGWCYIL